MTQVVSSKPYCLENSSALTRPASEAFYRIDGSRGPTVIDKHQAKRLFRLQRAPSRESTVHVDNSDYNFGAEGYLADVLRRQVNGSSAQSITAVYRRPTDMSNASLARFSLGKARLDPQRLVPSEATSLRNHPSASIRLR